MDKIAKTKAIIASSLTVVILFVVALLPKKQGTVTYTQEPASTPTTSSMPTTTVSPAVVPVVSQPVPSAPAVPVATAPTSPYKDGTYTATGSYGSPAGTEDIQVSLTLKDGIIEDSNVVAEAQDGRSANYQARFIAAYKQYVIGRSVTEVNLGKISGSSLTPQGWNNAVAKIVAEARA